MPQTIMLPESRKIMICVDSYEDDVLKGWFCNLSWQIQQFSSWSQFLLKMEQILGQMQPPQSYTALRRYSVPGDAPEETPEPGPVRGTQATFELKVIFRQHTSWQGILLWREENSEHSFRSVLELVSLMDSALRKSKENKAV